MIAFLINSAAAGAFGGVMVAMALISWEMVTGENVTNMTKGVGFAIGGLVLGPLVGFLWYAAATLLERRAAKRSVDEVPSNVHQIHQSGKRQPPPPGPGFMP